MMKDARSNSHSLFKLKRPLRVIAFITLWSFLFTTGGGEYFVDYAYAARTSLEPTRVGSNGVGSTGALKEINAETFTLPRDLGTIKSSWLSGKKASPTIIHVQDAHCNYDVQNTISNIIRYLNSEYGIGAVNLEGGAGEYDLSLFADIEDAHTRSKVTDRFVKEGFVNGAESFAINNPGKVDLWGVEKIKLYVDNLSVYRESLKHKKDVEKHLNSLNHILNNLKRNIFSKELLDLDTKYSQNKAGNTEFKEYFLYVANKAKEKNVRIKNLINLSLLVNSLEQEDSINFKVANTERDELIDGLQKILSKNEIKELVSKTVELKTEKISQKDFYSYLARKADSIRLDTTKFPELQKYMTYVATYDVIDQVEIEKELGVLENRIRESLYSSDKQRKLNSLSKNLALMRNIFNVSIIRSDYDYYTNNTDSFLMKNYVSFIDREAPLYRISAKLDENIADLDRYREETSKFYKYCFDRDEAFLKNIKFSNNVAILIAGGFHTENLSNLFKKSGISYVSIMPNVANITDYENPYFNILKGEISGSSNRIYNLLSSIDLSLLAVPDLLNKALGEEVWGKRNIDRFRAWVGLEEIAEQENWSTNDVTNIERQDNNLIITLKSGQRTIKITKLFHQAGESIDRGMYGFVDLITDDQERNAALELAGKLSSDAAFTAGLVYLTDNKRGLHIQEADGLPDGQNEHAGGYGVTIRKGLRGDAKIEAILHGIVAGFVEDHNRTDDIVEALMKEHRELVKDFSAARALFAGSRLRALWDMTPEERFDVDRDFALMISSGGHSTGGSDRGIVLHYQATGDLVRLIHADGSKVKFSVPGEGDNAYSVCDPVKALNSDRQYLVLMVGNSFELRPYSGIFVVPFFGEQVNMVYEDGQLVIGQIITLPPLFTGQAPREARCNDGKTLAIHGGMWLARVETDKQMIGTTDMHLANNGQEVVMRISEEFRAHLGNPDYAKALFEDGALKKVFELTDSDRNEVFGIAEIEYEEEIESFVADQITIESDLDAGELFQTPHAYLPDGRILLWTNGQEVKIWDMNTKRAVVIITDEHVLNKAQAKEIVTQTLDSLSIEVTKTTLEATKYLSSFYSSFPGKEEAAEQDHSERVKAMLEVDTKAYAKGLRSCRRALDGRRKLFELLPVNDNEGRAMIAGDIHDLEEFIEDTKRNIELTLAQMESTMVAEVEKGYGVLGTFYATHQTDAQIIKDIEELVYARQAFQNALSLATKIFHLDPNYGEGFADTENSIRQWIKEIDGYIEEAGGGAWFAGEGYRRWIAPWFEPLLVVGIMSLIASPENELLRALFAGGLFFLPHVILREKGFVAKNKRGLAALTLGTSIFGFFAFRYGFLNPNTVAFFALFTLVHFAINWWPDVIKLIKRVKRVEGEIELEEGLTQIADIVNTLKQQGPVLIAIDGERANVGKTNLAQRMMGEVGRDTIEGFAPKEIIRILDSAFAGTFKEIQSGSYKPPENAELLYKLMWEDRGTIKVVPTYEQYIGFYFAMHLKELLKDGKRIVVFDETNSIPHFQRAMWHFPVIRNVKGTTHVVNIYLSQRKGKRFVRYSVSPWGFEYFDAGSTIEFGTDFGQWQYVDSQGDITSTRTDRIIEVKTGVGAIRLPNGKFTVDAGGTTKISTGEAPTEEPSGEKKKQIKALLQSELRVFTEWNMQKVMMAQIRKQQEILLTKAKEIDPAFHALLKPVLEQLVIGNDEDAERFTNAVRKMNSEYMARPGVDMYIKERIEGGIILVPYEIVDRNIYTSSEGIEKEVVYLAQLAFNETEITTGFSPGGRAIYVVRSQISRELNQLLQDMDNPNINDSVKGMRSRDFQNKTAETILTMLEFSILLHELKHNIGYTHPKPGLLQNQYEILCELTALALGPTPHYMLDEFVRTIGSTGAAGRAKHEQKVVSAEILNRLAESEGIRMRCGADDVRSAVSIVDTLIKRGGRRSGNHIKDVARRAYKKFAEETKAGPLSEGVIGTAVHEFNSWLGKQRGLRPDERGPFGMPRVETDQSATAETPDPQDTGEIIGPEVTAEQKSRWDQQISDRRYDVILSESNYNTLKRVSDRCVRLRDRYQDIDGELIARGKPGEIQKVKDALENQVQQIGLVNEVQLRKLDDDVMKMTLANSDYRRLSFRWFESRVVSDEEYYLGGSNALAVDIIEFLRMMERTLGIPDLVDEYILHEVLERIDFGHDSYGNHREIIAVTAKVFNRPEGQNPLGKALRSFITYRLKYKPAYDFFHTNAIRGEGLDVIERRYAREVRVAINIHDAEYLDKTFKKNYDLVKEWIEILKRLRLEDQYDNAEVAIVAIQGSIKKSSPTIDLAPALYEEISQATNCSRMVERAMGRSGHEIEAQHYAIGNGQDWLDNIKKLLPDLLAKHNANVNTDQKMTSRFTIRIVGDRRDRERLEEFILDELGSLNIKREGKIDDELLNKAWNRVHIIQVNPGEEAKSLNTVIDLFTDLAIMEHDRYEEDDYGGETPWQVKDSLISLLKLSTIGLEHLTRKNLQQVLSGLFQGFRLLQLKTVNLDNLIKLKRAREKILISL